MRARLHIERRVARLASSLTLDVISKVINRLEQPKSKFTGWECRCIYCNLHGAYTLSRRNQTKASKIKDEGIVNDYYYIIEALHMGKRKLEALGLTHDLSKHIEKAKQQIGVMPMNLLRFNYQTFIDYDDAVKLAIRAGEFRDKSEQTWGIPTKFFLKDMYE